MQGDHTVFRFGSDGRVSNYQTFHENDRCKGGFQPGPRFRGSGKPHGGQKPPIIINKGRARPPEPHELPRGFK